MKSFPGKQVRQPKGKDLRKEVPSSALISRKPGLRVSQSHGIENFIKESGAFKLFSRSSISQPPALK